MDTSIIPLMRKYNERRTEDEVFAEISAVSRLRRETAAKQGKNKAQVFNSET